EDVLRDVPGVGLLQPPAAAPTVDLRPVPADELAPSRLVGRRLSPPIPQGGAGLLGGGAGHGPGPGGEGGGLVGGARGPRKGFRIHCPVWRGPAGAGKKTGNPPRGPSAFAKRG